MGENTVFSFPEAKKPEPGATEHSEPTVPAAPELPAAIAVEPAAPEAAAPAPEVAPPAPPAAPPEATAPELTAPIAAAPPSETAPPAPESAEPGLADMEAAADGMALMTIVSTLEKSPGIGANPKALYDKAHEQALRVGDREAALMYGNRLTAIVSSEAANRMHQATQGMMESAHKHAGAASASLEAARINSSVASRGA